MGTLSGSMLFFGTVIHAKTVFWAVGYVEIVHPQGHPGP